jgi:hypothetical protein
LILSSERRGIILQSSSSNLIPLSIKTEKSLTFIFFFSYYNRERFSSSYPPLPITIGRGEGEGYELSVYH